jgi:SAM-dependent methyltransferase
MAIPDGPRFGRMGVSVTMRDMIRRHAPTSGYVHPRAGRAPDHARGLEIASESSPNYHRWIAQLCRPYIGQNAVEIGAGHGAVTRFLAEGVTNYTATDVSPECLAVLRTRFRDSPNVKVSELDVLSDELNDTFDSVIMINVLEHLRDDAGTLRSLSRHLEPDGNFIVYVPAFNSLFGDWDDRAGHFRRYSKRQLEHVMRAADLRVVESRYVNLLAIPAWFAFSRLRIRNRPEGPDTALGRDLRVWDRTAVPATRWVEARVRVPVGLNVFAVGTLPGD